MLISEKEYLDKLKALIDKFFKDRAEYAENYMDEMKDYMNSVMSYYNSVISGVTTLLDHRISSIQDTKDSTINALEEEKEAAEEAYQAQIDAIQEEIDALDDLIDKKNEEIDALNDQIQAIEDANAARDRSIQLQKAEYELQRAQNQRTKLVYTGEIGTMRYETDTSAIRDQQEAVKDAQDEIAIAAIEKQIKLIEDEIEAIEKQKKALEDQQEELQKAMESTSKYYEKMIKEQEKMFDDMIKKLEETKKKWEELAAIEELSKSWGLVSEAMAEYGYTVEDVLNDTPGAFEAFKNEYLRILQEMHSGDKGFLEGVKEFGGQAPSEFQKVASAASETEEPIKKLGDTAGTTSGKVTTLGTTASNAATGVEQLKKASEGIDEGLSKVQQVDFTELKGKLEEVTSDIQSAIDLIGDPSKTASLYGVLNSLNTLTFTDLIKNFMLLQTAVNGVLSALSGTATGGEESALATGAAAGAVAVTGGETGGAGGIVGALQSVQQASNTTIGGGGGGSTEEGEASTESDGTVTGDFLALNGAISKASTAIGTTESDEKSADLIGSIVSLGVKDQEVLQGGESGSGVISDWNSFNLELDEAEQHVTKLVDGLNNLKDSYETSLTVHLTVDEQEFTGTATRGKKSGEWSVKVLDAMGLPGDSGDWISHLSHNAKGTAKIPARFAGEWGYHGGKTLIAELGPELVVFPDGHAQTFDKPQIVDLPRGSVIFNHLKKVALHGDMYCKIYLIAGKSLETV